MVNRETEGFAHSAYVVHGTNLCAFGLAVAAGGEALARAKGLVADAVRPSVGEGELALDALLGVGGSLLYLVPEGEARDRQWERDFALAPGWNAHRGAGLERVDHLAQTVRTEDILSWTLFYRSIFALDPLPSAEVADPGGLVRSQVIENADGSLRLVLNASQSPRTQSARFMRQFVGPGVQHVAFATSDILATAAAVRANGVPLLAIPQNYYDDLEARFDLAPAMLECLRQNGILYDRDEGGAYFQLYLDALPGGFFFEIVQRDGYRGLGAPNAPIRLATQARRRPEGLPAA